jgi:hypothetical protein
MIQPERRPQPTALSIPLRQRLLRLTSADLALKPPAGWLPGILRFDRPASSMLGSDVPKVTERALSYDPNYLPAHQGLAFIRSQGEEL